MQMEILYSNWWHNEMLTKQDGEKEWSGGHCHYMIGSAHSTTKIYLTFSLIFFLQELLLNRVLRMITWLWSVILKKKNAPKNVSWMDLWWSQIVQDVWEVWDWSEILSQTLPFYFISDLPLSLTICLMINHHWYVCISFTSFQCSLLADAWSLISCPAWLLNEGIVTSTALNEWIMRGRWL